MTMHSKVDIKEYITMYRKVNSIECCSMYIRQGGECSPENRPAPTAIGCLCTLKCTVYIILNSADPHNANSTTYTDTHFLSENFSLGQPFQTGCSDKLKEILIHTTSEILVTPLQLQKSATMFLLSSPWLCFGF